MAFSFDQSLLNPKSLPELASRLQKVFADLEDSLSSTPGLQSDTGQGYSRTNIGDLLTSQVNGNITFKFVTSENASVDVTIGPATTKLNSNYLHQTVTAALPTVAEYPSDGNWGFHTNTATGKIYLTLNAAGVIKKVELT